MAKILKVLFLFVTLLVAEDESAFMVTSLARIKSQDTILQKYEESCGAAALATLMGLFGVKKSEQDILDKVAKSDMLSFAELSNTAKEFGFRAEGYRIDKSSFEKLTLPVIAKIEREKDYPHFVVALNHKGDFVSVLDPSFGRYILTKDEFCGLWQKNQIGYILIALPQGSVANTIFEAKIPAPNFLTR